jgi:PilZ domain-containing protein
MSAWLGRRTEPRVDFREAVRVIWPGEVSGVLARAVNLSPAGILVDAPPPTPCPVGSDVLCDVTLPHGPRLLRGRVAHRRLLPSEKIGMGIEFIDLSPREVAELRDVVGGSDEKPQRVKVRFRGTDQVVSARAIATEDGFRLATALPFLKLDTEVDISLAPAAGVSARGWVSRVSLEHASPSGAPRLLIDVRVDDPDPWRDDSAARTPVVESLLETLGEAVPEHVWEPEELGASAEPAPFGVSVDVDADAGEPTLVTAAPTTRLEDPGAAPATITDADRTEIVTLEARPSRWRALGGGMIAGVIALAAFLVVIVVIKAVGLAVGSRSAPAASLPPPVVIAEAPASAPTPRAVEAPVTPPAVAAPLEPAATPAEDLAPIVVGLTGSLAGATRYPLRKPDGVAFNLPHARATMRVGTYSPDVPGLKSMWVRALPGGGVHLRFFFASTGAAPRVALERDGVRVGAR